MSDDPLLGLVAWLKSETVEPLDEKWVPGATEDERRSLSALGGVVRQLLGERANAVSWPVELTEWWSDAVMPPSEVVAPLLNIAVKERASRFAKLYETLVASPHRRHLGTFFTPDRLVAKMLDSWRANHPDPAVVVDVGAGVGVFTAAAADRWPGAQVWAVDVNPVTLGLLAALVADSFTIAGTPPPGSDAHPGIHLVLDDFIGWSTGQAAPGKPRLILGNPPYTRLQLISKDDRLRFADAVPNLCGSRASLSTWMLGAALQMLGPDDGVCLLLPTHWLEAQYAKDVRLWLWTSAHRRVELTLHGPEHFAGALVDAVAISVGPQTGSAEPFLLNTEDSAVTTLDRSRGVPPTFRDLFVEPTATRQPSQRRKAKPVPLSDIATVRRGVATGANAFFVVSDSTVEEWKLPRRLLRRLARRLRTVGSSFDLETFNSFKPTDARWLLVAEKADRVLPDLEAYIRHGEELDLPDRVLCQSRDVWFDLRHDISTPDVIVGPMTRDLFHLVTNECDALITNNLYGMQWRDHAATDRNHAVLSWLRGKQGQAAIKGAARRQAHGLFKIEPGALRSILLPASVASS